MTARGLTIAEMRDTWTEAQFQNAVLNVAKAGGWRVYHTHNSMHSAKGFPDLVLVKDGRLVFAELKSKTGKVTPEQEAWLAALGDVVPEMVAAHVWRPGDWDDLEGVLA